MITHSGQSLALTLAFMGLKWELSIAPWKAGLMIAIPIPTPIPIPSKNKLEFWIKWRDQDVTSLLFSLVCLLLLWTEAINFHKLCHHHWSHSCILTYPVVWNPQLFQWICNPLNSFWSGSESWSDDWIIIYCRNQLTTCRQNQHVNIISIFLSTSAYY